MKKINISKKWIILIAIIAVIAIVVVANNVKQENIKKEIIAGYSEIIDEVLEEYLSGTGTDRWGDTRKNKYAIQMGLGEIDYEIVNITSEEGLYRGSHDDTYVLTVEIRLSCSKSGSREDIEELADEVFWTFYDVQSITSGIEIGEYECSYYPTDDPNYAYEDLITIYVNGEKIISPYWHEPDNDKDDKDDIVKCRRSGCGREAKYTDWNRRYCSEHINETHYCRYPGCLNEISNYSGDLYCHEHD